MGLSLDEKNYESIKRWPLRFKQNPYFGQKSKITNHTISSSLSVNLYWPFILGLWLYGMQQSVME